MSLKPNGISLFIETTPRTLKKLMECSYFMTYLLLKSFFFFQILEAGIKGLSAPNLEGDRERERSEDPLPPVPPAGEASEVPPNPPPPSSVSPSPASVSILHQSLSSASHSLSYLPCHFFSPSFSPTAVHRVSHSGFFSPLIHEGSDAGALLSAIKCCFSPQ